MTTNYYVILQSNELRSWGAGDGIFCAWRRASTPAEAAEGAGRDLVWSLFGGPEEAEDRAEWLEGGNYDVVAVLSAARVNDEAEGDPVIENASRRRPWGLGQINLGTIGSETEPERETKV